MQGDRTLSDRLQFFREQRKSLQEQIRQLQQTLDIVNYNCWYYETALSKGSTLPMKKLTEEEIPQSSPVDLNSIMLPRSVMEPLQKSKKVKFESDW